MESCASRCAIERSPLQAFSCVYVSCVTAEYVFTLNAEFQSVCFAQKSTEKQQYMDNNINIGKLDSKYIFKDIGLLSKRSCSKVPKKCIVRFSK